MKIRQKNKVAIESFFAQETRSWTPADHLASPQLSHYFIVHGITHLLALGRHDDAVQRLLDIDYIARFIDAYEEKTIQALRIWRATGAEVLELAYHELIKTQVKSQLDDASVLNHWDSLSEFLEELGHYEITLELCQWINDQAQRIADLDTGDVDYNLNRLASLLNRLGRYNEAEQIFKEQLSKEIKLYGEDALDTLIVKANLARCYTDQGRYQLAESILLDVLEKRVDLLGMKHERTLLTQTALATVYIKLDKKEQAYDLLAVVAQNREEVLGIDHPATQDSLHDLAVILEDLKRYEEALPVIQKVVDTSIWMMGITHPKTLSSMELLAGILSTLNRLDEALQLQIEICQRVETRMGRRCLPMVRALTHLGSTYHKLKDHRLAEECFREAMSISDEVLPSNHSDRTIPISWLTLLLSDQERFTEAEQLCLDVHTLNQQAFGNHHSCTWESRKSLAKVYVDQEKYASALPLYQDLVEHIEQVHGRFHPESFDAQSMLARVYRELNKIKKAFKVFLRLYEGQCKVLGEAHPDTRTSLLFVANLSADLGQKKAESYFHKLVNLQRQVCGEESDEFESALHFLAMFYEDLEQTKKAINTYKTLIDLSLKVHGADHGKTLSFQYELALLYRETDRLEKAKILFSLILEKRESSLGLHHEETLACLPHLGIICDLLGEETEAERYFLESKARHLLVHGKTSLNLVQSLDYLLIFYESQNEYEKKYEHESHLLDIYIENQGTLDEDTLRVRYGRGESLLQLERFEEALVEFRLTLEGEETVFGSSDPDLSMTHWHIAQCYRKLDGLKEAIHHHFRCWELEVLKDGVSASSVLKTALSLVEGCMEAGHFDQARVVINTSLAAAKGHKSRKSKKTKRSEYIAKLKEYRSQLKS